MDTIKILTSDDHHQVIQLPNEYRFDVDEVIIFRDGDNVVLAPKKSDWTPLLESLNEFTSDYMENRHQPEEQQIREGMD